MDLQGQEATVIATALFFLSEALALIPAVKANSVFQLFVGLVKSVAKRP